MMTSQNWRRAVESWTSDVKVKIGGRWDRVHWIYSDTVFYGEGFVAMETAYGVELLRNGPLTVI